MVNFKPNWVVARAVVLGLLFCGPGRAGDVPIVTFSVPWTVSCQDLTTDAYGRKYPDTRLVEAIIEVSPRLVSGEEKDLKELTIEITSPGDQIPIQEHLPTTTLTSDVVGEAIFLEQETREDKVLLKYRVAPRAGEAGGHAASVRSKTVLTKLAPKSVLVASASTKRSYGVSFQLAPSARDTVRKPFQFTCLFEVPRSFRADYLQVDCEAVGFDRGLFRFLDGKVVCGSAGFVVGIYLDGDQEAKRAADGIAKRQQALFDEINAHSMTLMEREKGFWSKFFAVLEWWLTQSDKWVAAGPNVVGAFFVPKLVVGIEHKQLSEADLPGEIADRIRELRSAQRDARSLSSP